MSVLEMIGLVLLVVIIAVFAVAVLGALFAGDDGTPVVEWSECEDDSDEDCTVEDVVTAVILESAFDLDD
jgi:hypothetical protein